MTTLIDFRTRKHLPLPSSQPVVVQPEMPMKRRINWIGWGSGLAILGCLLYFWYMMLREAGLIAWIQPQIEWIVWHEPGKIVIAILIGIVIWQALKRRQRQRQVVPPPKVVRSAHEPPPDDYPPTAA